MTIIQRIVPLAAVHSIMTPPGANMCMQFTMTTPITLPLSTYSPGMFIDAAGFALSAASWAIETVTLSGVTDHAMRPFLFFYRWSR